MHALDNAEVTPAQTRVRRERRALAAVLIGLLITTAWISPLAFSDLPMLLLFCVPFALALLLVVLLAPLSVSAEDVRDAQHRAHALQTARQAAAAQHAIRTHRVDTLPQDEPAVLAAAVAAAKAHGIHFGSAHLRDEDFLQAFHACEIRAAEFRHGDHLRYTVLMLQRVPHGLVGETIARNLRTFLRTVCGSEALFHATRTHAWVTVLRALPHASFAHLLQQHAIALHGNALSRFYSTNLLNSDAARQRTVSPDLHPLPAPQAPISSRT